MLLNFVYLFLVMLEPSLSCADLSLVAAHRGSFVMCAGFLTAGLSVAEQFLGPTGLLEVVGPDSRAQAQ